MWPHFYSQQDSAYYYLKQIRKLTHINNDLSGEIETVFNICGVASFFFDLKTSDSSLKKLDTLINRIKNKKGEEFLTHTNTLLYYRGDFLLKQYEYKRSRECFERILISYENLEDSLKNQMQHDLYAASFSFLGKIYLEQGKYDLAKQLYNKSIRNIIKSDPNETEAIYDNYNLLAEVYQKEKYYSKANSYLLKTLQFNIDNKNTNNILSQTLKIAENYNMLIQRDSALYYLNVVKPYLEKNAVFVPRYHKVKSEIHSSGHEYQKAMAELNIALELAMVKSDGSPNIDIPVIYNKMAAIFLEIEDPKSAIEKYKLGLKEAFKIGNNKNIIIKLLKNKAKALNKIGGYQYFKETIKTVDFGVAVLDSLKPSFKSHSDKLVLIDDAFPLFESGIEAAYQLYASTGDEDFLNKAFQFAEKSKAVILLDALLAVNATKFGDIPEALLAKEAQLKSEINHSKRNLDRSLEKSIEKADRLFDLQQEYFKIVETFEKQYPKYYNLRYNNQVISSKSVQANLTHDELLVSYFYGDQAIYSISITNDSKQMSRIIINQSLEKNITNLHEMLSDSESNVDSLNRISFGIYQQLLKPHLENRSTTKLIIIPDGLLNYIPFDVLNTSHSSINYLMTNYTSSSINSVTLLNQLSTESEPNNKILAFAPEFNQEEVQGAETRAGLTPLPSNKNEVMRILNSFNGNSFFGNDASLSNFNTKVFDYNMIHLATHAVFNDNTPEYSYLAFTPKDSSEFALYVSDIYNLDINANLVTLSACETGIGELRRGEGAISLSRAFFYSGAKSLVNTLWNVADNSASEIMGGFYENLAAGTTKDESLRNAKLNFLKKNIENGLSHPYYWSGYIIQGNTQALVKPYKLYWYAVLAVVLFFIFLVRKPLLQIFK